jgi:toxin ParE1/3/4
MYKLSRQADQDLEYILDYTVVNFGVDQAIRYYESLRNCLTVLDEQPGMGRAVEDIRGDYCRFEHRRHVIFYRLQEGGIFVVRVLHVQMDPARHLGDELEQ